MGFSVSGATALLLIAFFISLGIVSTAATNGFERVNDAYHADADRTLDRQNTAVSILNITCSPLNLSVKNTGTTALHVADTDVLVDNGYEPSLTYEVDGNASTDLWLPGQTLRIGGSTASDRVKVVTGPGVAVAGDC